MTKKRFLPLLCLFCWLMPHVLLSQQYISGQITDPEGTILPFVSILINDQPGLGVLSDIEGRFKIEAKKVPVQSLSFRYVGYEPLRLDSGLLAAQRNRTLAIVLKPSDLQLAEAVITPRENYANVLIRRAVANRNKNNPERNRSFVCTTYNKVHFESMPNRLVYERNISEKDSSAKRMQEIRQRFAELEKSSSQRHLFVMESVTEHSFMSPNTTREKVLLDFMIF